MKYGIYKGDIVEITGSNGSLLHFVVNGEGTAAHKGEIILIPNNEFAKIEAELTAVRKEIKELKVRMYNLDDAYQKKTEALHELMLTARQKEIAIVSQFVKASIMKGDSNEAKEQLSLP